MKRIQKFLVLLAGGLVVYFSLIGFWVGFYTQRKIVRDLKSSVGLVVKIGYSHIYPFTGSGVLKNIRIENPDGFSSKHAFTIDEIRFEGNVRSLYSDEINLDAIQIVNPTLHIESKNQRTNLEALALRAKGVHVIYRSTDQKGFKRIRTKTMNISSASIWVYEPGSSDPKQLSLSPIVSQTINADSSEQEARSLRSLGNELARTYLAQITSKIAQDPDFFGELSHKILGYSEMAQTYLRQ